ncbi:hypothetical protein [Niabella aurantiaca]|uniref:hypothetical protein n=1 Tax=Niabella aurantiaca TaxID=379900 RepID=UPI000374873D|nr:hypothetical protein [Niabella aurantiaca]
MKKICCMLGAVLLLVTSSRAQDDPVEVRNANKDQPFEEKGFKKENLFTGGGVTASFYSGGSVLGVSPVLGYKINDYLDGGIVLNYVFNGARDVWGTNDRLKQHVWGPGAFLRAYPISFLFVQAQFEENFTNERYTTSTSSPVPSYKVNARAPSLLLGGGYSTGRIKGGTTFFYISILADVLKNWNSPYVDKRYDDYGNKKPVIIPVIRAGVNVGLFQGRYGRY